MEHTFVKIRIGCPLLADGLEHKVPLPRLCGLWSQDFSPHSAQGEGSVCQGSNRIRAQGPRIPRKLLPPGPLFLALPPACTQYHLHLSALVLADQEGAVSWPPPLPLVWIGSPSPHTQLMRSHSHEEPEHFPGLCPPQATPLGELPLSSIFSFLIASEKSESENAGKL